MTQPARNPAILLLGPTGAGKTPLGEEIARRGLWGRTCLHFDFGAGLRAVAQRDRPDEIISARDIEFVRDVLRTGALLEDKDFPLAERILRSTLARHGADARTLVVLNGLPRHVGQAEAVARILDVQLVVHLECPAETVPERIRTNVGGDRAARVDDDPEAVRRKLRLFAERTAPLLGYYRDRGVRLETVPVSATATPGEVWAALQRRPPCLPGGLTPPEK